MLSLILNVLVGGSLGALFGHFGSCSTGACPLTANWRRGMVYGGVLGLLFFLMAARGASDRFTCDPRNQGSCCGVSTSIPCELKP